MLLSRYTASRVSLFHTFPLTKSLIHQMNCFTFLGRVYIHSYKYMLNGRHVITGAPLSIYSILFTYYDPGDSGFDRAFSDCRTDIIIMYMRMRNGKRIHTKYMQNAFICGGHIDIFYYALENCLWSGSLDATFHTACMYGHIDAVTKLLPHVDVLSNYGNGLFQASRFARKDAVTLLLSRDTYPNDILDACIRMTHNKDVRSILLNAKVIT